MKWSLLLWAALGISFGIICFHVQHWPNWVNKEKKPTWQDIASDAFFRADVNNDGRLSLQELLTVLPDKRDAIKLHEKFALKGSKDLDYDRFMLVWHEYYIGAPKFHRMERIDSVD